MSSLAAILQQPLRPTALIAYNHMAYDTIMETAVKLPEGEMATLGVELLLKRVARMDAAAVGTQHMIPGPLKIGSTTGPAPAD